MMESEEYLEKGIEYLFTKLQINGDIIIPIARRGVRVLGLSPKFDEFYRNNRIIFFDSIRYHFKELKGKRIILFDEGMNSGETLFKLKNALKILSQEHSLSFDKSIYTAALIVNRNSKYDYPDFYPPNLLVSRSIYDRISNALHYKIISTGKPMDVDHPIARISISNGSIDNFISILRKYYKAKELSYSRMFSGVRMFTIDFSVHENIPCSFMIPEKYGSNNLFADGPLKIRVYIKNFDIYVVPIIFPMMRLDDKELVESEKDLSAPPCKLLNLCEIIKIPNNDDSIKDNKDEVKTAKSIICYNCIVNDLSISLLCEFISSFGRFELRLNFEGMDENYIQIASYSENQQIIKSIERKVQTLLEVESRIIGNGIEAKKCNLKVLN